VESLKNYEKIQFTKHEKIIEKFLQEVKERENLNKDFVYE